MGALLRSIPYSAAGIGRVPCARCRRPSAFQWQICADGNQYRPLCKACDVELNTIVMRFVFGETKEAVIEAYRKRVLGE